MGTVIEEFNVQKADASKKLLSPAIQPILLNRKCYGTDRA